MVRFIRYSGVVLLTASLFLTACSLSKNTTPTPDPKAIYTAAAETVGAQMTQSIILTPSITVTPTTTQTETQAATTAAPTGTITTPTATLAATSTATFAVLPDKAEFVSQSIADGTRFNTGQPITITWVLKNVGTTTWSKSYSAKFYAGDLMGAAPSVSLTQDYKPGDQLQITVNFVAPSNPGKYGSIWVLQNADGHNFFPFYLNVEVVAATATNTPPPAPTHTPQPSTTPTPTVTTTP